MKTVKFKDLPEKVKAFYRREICLMSSWEYVSLDKLHTMSEWSQATSEERLAYAEWRYKIGTSVMCAYDCVKSTVNRLDFDKGISQPKDIWICNGDICLYEGDKNKWAEIISEPEKEEPTFKAGDEVDHKFVNTEWLSEKAIFTGGFNTKGNPIVEVNGDLHVVKEIRKPDPDKAYREIAKEIMCVYAVKADKVKSNIIYFDTDVESMLIEMGKKVETIKKGKEL